jgi:hypothetical protein
MASSAPAPPAGDQKGNHPMAGVTGPLLSFGASGQIGKSAVFSRWKGVPYVRRYVVPANPQSADQTLTRTAFAWLNAVYKIAPADFRAAWALAAKGNPVTDRNLLLRQNLSNLRGQSDLTGLIMSPGARGGIAAPFVATPGDDLITVTADAPDPLPAGWSVIRFIAACIRQQDPQSGVLYEIVTGSDAAAAYSVVLAGLASAQHYMAAGWFEYQRSASATDLAYGPATAVDVLTT